MTTATYTPPPGAPATEPVASGGPVVTLVETYGSGADYVGRMVADALGVRFVGPVYSPERLEDVEVTPVLNPTVLLPADESERDALVRQNNADVIAATARGGVVLGRDATVVLADNPGALHVKLDAPVDVRIARAAKDAGIDLDRAAQRQSREDEVRTALSLLLYDWDPRETGRYDLVVNTGRLDLDVVVALVLDAVRAKARA